MDKTAAERQARRSAKMRAAGYTKISAWVPNKLVVLVRKLIADTVAQH